MGLAENRAKNSKMAADLKARGIWHGKRTTTTHCPPVPNQRDVGSAWYRRWIASQRAKQNL